MSVSRFFRTSLFQEPVDMMNFNRLSRILNLRKVSGDWSCVLRSVNANGCVTLDLIRVVFRMLAGWAFVPTLLDVVAALLLFLLHALLVKVERWMPALWPQVRPALVMKWVVLRCLVQILLEVVSALFLMRLYALPGNVEVQSPELMLERAFALGLQVQVLESFDHVSLNALGRLQVSVQVALYCLR